tara:strand:+ start:1157 stop:1552 length:396 start_codon:yes stop_codon:yes gene_type:complete
MNYAKVENNQIVKYPYTRNDLRSDNLNTSFPKNILENTAFRSEYGIIEVHPVSAPESDTHNSTEADPVQVNGAWTQTWQQSEKSVEEKNAVIIQKRVSEYGIPEQQLEFITENGLEAWQSKVAEIKARHPK